ncbi:hypothetical protein [Spiroplasma endosymbiont of Megaselia nigra]|uniref:hypothetical protein n=1 Tax=Spiroplasma endosymbiont of Megaselia nigra TaxID=2478537 RepID=UPI000F86D193|nr:hypothetical protein [Spiroplasma endosymbiont of Megaselia nigra]RUO85710.1 hypothetical protein D9R21_07170 [Spiroplasma endosymbiont of Megaselia nigra]
MQTKVIGFFIFKKRYRIEEKLKIVKEGLQSSVNKINYAMFKILYIQLVEESVVIVVKNSQIILKYFN